jgi:adenylylsulfate kinase-like enzyme
MASLDADEVSAWLTRVTQTVDRSIRDADRAALQASLQSGLSVSPGSFGLLVQLALLDDCLRIAHQAIEADGRIDAEEIARIGELVKLGASKYSPVLPVYRSFAGPLTAVDVARFVRVHREDKGPFGYGSKNLWSGLHVVRQVEKLTRNASPLRDHERMLARVMEEVFAGRSSEVERKARRELHAMFVRPTVVGLDPRALAFCRADGPEVFASVAHGSQIHERDPFDVESIHAEVREVFHSQVTRAGMPEHVQRGHGRTLLVLGESGAGKTHLLRALRAQVHSSGIGYVGYMQMTSEAGDYARYVLRSFIDSMERPYNAPVKNESALMYLSDGLVETRVTVPPDELERLRTAEIIDSELDFVVGRIVDHVLRTEGLETLDSDLLHALLLLQRRDPALQRRVVKYLRCEALTEHDRKLLGGLSARTQPEDPQRTIVQLAAIMSELQMAAMVIVVDQIEDAIPDGQTITRLQVALDSLRAISDAVPSAVIVISCLDDVYTAVRPKLSRSLVDRLESDPPPVRLTSQRQLDEVEQMLARRLEHLFTELDVAWRDDDPLYPFTRAQVEAASQLRARDALARFREYHSACIAIGELVGQASTQATEVAQGPHAQAKVTPSYTDMERSWNQRKASTIQLPEDDAGVLDLVEQAVRLAIAERGLGVQVKAERGQLRLHDQKLGERIVAVCNRQPQGGHLGKQIDALKKLRAQGVLPFAMRNGDFQFKPKSVIAQQIGEFVGAGGRTVALEESELRAVIAYRQLSSISLPEFTPWSKATLPISQLAFVRAVLDLDAVPAAVPTVVPTPTAPTKLAPAAAPDPTSTQRVSSPISMFDPSTVRLGVTTSLRAEPVTIPVEQFKSHATFLGGTGSGKTTAALSVIEQLLERGVSALLLDRKGDLARYASEAWWSDKSQPDHERRASLRSRIDIDLFTPGSSAGRSLRLPLFPNMADATPNERTQLAQFAASGLGAMMGYGNSGTQKNRLAVLQCAIELHAGERDVSLEVLQDTINRPDPDLLKAVGALQRHFAPLSEDLQSLRIQRGPLLAGDGEMLEVDRLLPSSGSRPRLTIINTAALTDVALLQFWVSRLLVELARLSRKRPSATLQGVAFFDEADAYIPAVGAPPTKEPMFDLLRRARSGGLGVLLATQNPGDFDYKARDNIGTWLIGKVAQDRAIEKMRNIIGQYPNVGPRLATQPTGHFFVISASGVKESRCDRSMMQTEQMPESEVIEIARASR